MASFSQFLLESHEQYRQDLRIRNKWMIRLRWFYVVMLPSVAILAVLAANDSRYYIRVYLLVMAAGLLVNGALLLTTTWAHGSTAYYRTIALLQILLDLILASAVVYAGEGADSRAVALYAIPIVVSGVLFSRPSAYIAALLSSVAYVSVIVIYPFIHHVSNIPRLILSPGIFFPSFFFLLAAIVTRFSTINAMNERQRSYHQLLAMLRHQLHQPTSVIAAIVEMLENSENYDKFSAKDKDYIRHLKGENMRLNSMITNLLEAVSDPVDAPLKHPEKIDLLELLNDSATNCAIGARRLKDLVAKLPNEHIMLDAQPQHMRTALDNVIENAFRYSPEGTPVTVTMTHDKDSGDITIKVADKGPGMTREEKGRLFELFTRLKEHSGDPDKEAQQLYTMGLGLYVSKVIIERHHGILKIESKKDVGTSIIITIQEKLWLRPEFYT